MSNRLLRRQRKIADYYDFWWQNKYSKWDPDERKAIYRNAQFPRPRPKRQRVPRTTRVGKQKMAGRPLRAPLMLNYLRGNADREDDAQQRVDETMTDLKDTRVELVKILGWGGNGVAALFDVRDVDDGRERVVAKMAFSDLEDILDGERVHHRVSESGVMDPREPHAIHNN